MLPEHIKPPGQDDVMMDLDNPWATGTKRFLMADLEPGEGTWFAADKVIGLSSPQPESRTPPIEEPIRVPPHVDHSQTAGNLEKEIVTKAMQALEGVIPAIEFLESGLGKACIYPAASSTTRLLEKICR